MGGGEGIWYKMTTQRQEDPVFTTFGSVAPVWEFCWDPLGLRSRRTQPTMLRGSSMSSQNSGSPLFTEHTVPPQRREKSKFNTLPNSHTSQGFDRLISPEIPGNSLIFPDWKVHRSTFLSLSVSLASCSHSWAPLPQDI